MTEPKESTISYNLTLQKAVFNFMVDDFFNENQ